MTERRQFVYGIVTWVSLAILLLVLIYFGVGKASL